MESDNFYATFRHLRVPDIAKTPERGRTTYDQVLPVRPKPTGGITEALICDKTSNMIVFCGVSFCSHEEHYKKLKGRSIAFGRLLRHIKLNVGFCRLLIIAYSLFTQNGTKYDWKLVKDAYQGKKID